MEELIQRTVGPEIKVETRLATDIWSILCDANQLESAILNLCINARHAMPDGGTIVIGTANTSLEDGSASWHNAAPRQYAEISILDSGCGMSRDVLARAFDPFFTTKPTDQGTGLGLSMVYGFAKQSGGDVRIYSEVGAGTTVRLYLPRAHDISADDAELVIPAAPNSAGQGKSILVVDDEPAIRMLLTEVLEELGCYPLEAADGVAAMKVLQMESRIDLLITDIRMPGGVGGVELAAHAQQHRPTLKVLFITGYDGGEPLAGGGLKPGMQVLHKPFALEELVKKLNGLLA
jgi:CheY-like chemotaxis protein